MISMPAYRGLERGVARALESLPWVRSSVRAAYRRANYVYFHERGFRCELHPAARIESATEWCGGSLRAERGVFFGYFDKSPWSPDMRRAIVHRVAADGRRAAVLVLDREARRCSVVGDSSAWTHQQGSMAQWLPCDGGRSLLFNDCVGGVLMTRIVTIANGAHDADATEERRALYPVQAVHPRAPVALSLNYRRLASVGSEYGYAADASNFAPDQSPERDGLWRVDLTSGEGVLVVRLADLVANAPRPETAGSRHQVNHALYSPSGRRYLFLHRWTGPRGRFSRLYVANDDGGGDGGGKPRLLLDDRMVSHYAWLDETRVLAWARTREAGDGYHVIDVATGARQRLGAGVLDVYGDGHPSLSPDGRWLVTDSYPDRGRQRHLLLYDLAAGTRVDVGRFHAPWRFDGAERCDLPPRWSPDGRAICSDSAHAGPRRTYFVDVHALVGAPSA